jgi:hypothetical protein
VRGRGLTDRHYASLYTAFTLPIDRFAVHNRKDKNFILKQLENDAKASHTQFPETPERSS